MKIANSDNQLTSSMYADELDTDIINLYKQRRPLPKPPLITLLEKILDKPIKLGEKIAHEDTIGEAVTAFATNINYYAMAVNLLSWLGTHPKADEAYDYWVKRAEDELNDENMEDATLAMQTACFLFILKEISTWYIDLKNEASHKIDDTLKILDMLKPILLPGFGMKIYESSTLAKIDKEISARKKLIDSFKIESIAQSSVPAESFVKKTSMEAPKILLNPIEKINQWHSDNKIDKLFNSMEFKRPFLKEEIEKLKPFVILKEDLSKFSGQTWSHQSLPVPNINSIGIMPNHIKSGSRHSPIFQHLANNDNLMLNIAAIPPAHPNHFSNNVGMFSRSSTKSTSVKSKDTGSSKEMKSPPLDCMYASIGINGQMGSRDRYCREGNTPYYSYNNPKTGKPW